MDWRCLVRIFSCVRRFLIYLFNVLSFESCEDGLREFEHSWFGLEVDFWHRAPFKDEL